MHWWGSVEHNDRMWQGLNINSTKLEALRLANKSCSHRWRWSPYGLLCSHHTQHNVGALNHCDLGGTSESHLQDQFLIRVKWRAAQNPSLSFLVRPRRLQLFQYFQLFQYIQLFQRFQLFPGCVPITYTRTPLDGQTVDRGVKFQNSAAFSHYRKLNCFPRTAHTQSD